MISIGTRISQNVDMFHERSYHPISFTHSIICVESLILSKTVDDK